VADRDAGHADPLQPLLEDAFLPGADRIEAEIKRRLK